MKSLYQQAEAHIAKLFQGEYGVEKHPLMIKHLIRTAYWVKALRPDADEALLVAAVSHDIERAYKHKRPEGITEAENTGRTFTNPAYMQHHQE